MRFLSIHREREAATASSDYSLFFLSLPIGPPPSLPLPNHHHLIAIPVAYLPVSLSIQISFTLLFSLYPPITVAMPTNPPQPPPSGPLCFCFSSLFRFTHLRNSVNSIWRFTSEFSVPHPLPLSRLLLLHAEEPTPYGGGAKNKSQRPNKEHQWPPLYYPPSTSRAPECCVLPS